MSMFCNTQQLPCGFPSVVCALHAFKITGACCGHGSLASFWAQEFRPRTPFRKPHWLSQFAAVLSCPTHGKALDERNAQWKAAQRAR